MSLVAKVNALFQAKGSTVLFHRESYYNFLFPDENLFPSETLFPSGPCPCRTPEGYRDPKWHLANPSAPECNEQGLNSPAVEFTFKGFVQPIQSTRATRLSTEEVIRLVGEIHQDDHLGIFPISWEGNTVDLSNWSDSGDDWIGYNGDRFTVVNVNVIPDPSDGNPNHHTECGLRLLGDRRVGIA